MNAALGKSQVGYVNDILNLLKVNVLTTTLDIVILFAVRLRARLSIHPINSLDQRSVARTTILIGVLQPDNYQRINWIMETDAQ